LSSEEVEKEVSWFVRPRWEGGDRVRFNVLINAAKMKPIQISPKLSKDAQKRRAHLSFQAHSLPLCTASNNLDTAPSRKRPMLVPMTAPTLLGIQEANQTASVDGIVAWKYIFLWSCKGRWFRLIKRKHFKGKIELTFPCAWMIR
jgi:hypothetical protein